MYGERFGPAVKQLQEEEAFLRWYLIRVIDDEHVVGSGPLHPGQAVTRQERPQIVVSYPAVLPATVWEVVEEHVEDLVTDVVVRTVEEETQETAETDTRKWSTLTTFFLMLLTPKHNSAPIGLFFSSDLELKSALLCQV